MKIWKRFIQWVRSFFKKDEVEHIEFDYVPDVRRPPTWSGTKAYADQRQKAPWNRRKKPNKKMRNIYKLKGRV